MKPYIECVRSQPVPRPVFDAWWTVRSDPPLLDAFIGMWLLATQPARNTP